MGLGDAVGPWETSLPSVRAAGSWIWETEFPAFSSFQIKEMVGKRLVGFFPSLTPHLRKVPRIAESNQNVMKTV